MEGVPLAWGKRLEMGGAWAKNSSCWRSHKSDDTTSWRCVTIPEIDPVGQIYSKQIFIWRDFQIFDLFRIRLLRVAVHCQSIHARCLLPLPIMRSLCSWSLLQLARRQIGLLSSRKSAWAEFGVSRTLTNIYFNSLITLSDGYPPGLGGAHPSARRRLSHAHNPHIQGIQCTFMEYQLQSGNATGMSKLRFCLYV